MQDAPKAVWSISYVSVAFFPRLKQNFIAYRSFKVFSRPDCIFEIHQLWQSGFSSMYSNCCCSCSFEHEIIEIGQSSHKMYSNNILNFQETTTSLNACTKKSGNLLKAPCMWWIGLNSTNTVLLKGWLWHRRNHSVFQMILFWIRLYLSSLETHLPSSATSMSISCERNRGSIMGDSSGSKLLNLI